MCAKVVRLVGARKGLLPLSCPPHLGQQSWLDIPEASIRVRVMCPTLLWNAMDESKTENALMKLNFLVMEYNKMELKSIFRSRLNAGVSE